MNDKKLLFGQHVVGENAVASGAICLTMLALSALCWVAVFFVVVPSASAAPAVYSANVLVIGTHDNDNSFSFKGGPYPSVFFCNPYDSPPGEDGQGSFDAEGTTGDVANSLATCLNAFDDYAEGGSVVTANVNGDLVEVTASFADDPFGYPACPPYTWCSDVLSVSPGGWQEVVPAAIMCGDNYIDEGETCDDGGTASGDGCSDVCAVESGWDCYGEWRTTICMERSAVCGDSVIGEGETCDDGGTDPGDGCSDACAVEDGWQCAGEPSVCIEISAGPDFEQPADFIKYLFDDVKAFFAASSVIFLWALGFTVCVCLALIVYGWIRDKFGV